MQKQGPMLTDPCWLTLNSSKKIGRAPFSSQIELPRSQDAVFVDFSPSENWMIVGCEDSDDFLLYDLYQEDQGSVLISVKPPTVFTLDIPMSTRLQSVFWTADERFFFVHFEKSLLLHLYARNTSDNFQRVMPDEREALLSANR